MEKRKDRVRKAVCIAAFLLLAFQALIYFGDIGGRRLIAFLGNVGSIPAALFAVVGVFDAFISAKRRDRSRKVWLYLGSGLALYLIAEIIWAVYAVWLGVETPFPSVADAFWVAGYFPIFAGLFIMIARERQPEGKAVIRILLILSIFFLIVLMPFYLFLWGPEESFLGNMLNIFYPSADCVFIACGFTLIASARRWELEKTWWAVSLGMLLIGAADLLFSYLVSAKLYLPGHVIDLLWVAGYLFLGLGGFYQASLSS